MISNSMLRIQVKTLYIILNASFIVFLPEIVTSVDTAPQQKISKQKDLQSLSVNLEVKYLFKVHYTQIDLGFI